jgi:hypothetical protein
MVSVRLSQIGVPLWVLVPAGARVRSLLQWVIARIADGATARRWPQLRPSQSPLVER